MGPFLLSVICKIFAKLLQNPHLRTPNQLPPLGTRYLSLSAHLDSVWSSSRLHGPSAPGCILAGNSAAHIAKAQSADLVKGGSFGGRNMVIRMRRVPGLAERGELLAYSEGRGRTTFHGIPAESGNVLDEVLSYLSMMSRQHQPCRTCASYNGDDGIKPATVRAEIN